MLAGFLHSPKTFVCVMLGAALLAIFGPDPDAPPSSQVEQNSHITHEEKP